MDFKIEIDAPGMNRALFQVTHGLYILTAKLDGKVNGQCLDALMQITSRPPQIAIGVMQRNLTHEMIEKAGLFVVNVLDRESPDCMDMIRHFGLQSGRKVDKFANGFSYELSEGGIPILKDAKAFYECEVVPDKTLDLGTHSLFVGTVKRAGIREQGEPITYNEYRKIKSGGKKT